MPRGGKGGGGGTGGGVSRAADAAAAKKDARERSAALAPPLVPVPQNEADSFSFLSGGGASRSVRAAVAAHLYATLSVPHERGLDGTKEGRTRCARAKAVGGILERALHRVAVDRVIAALAGRGDGLVSKYMPAAARSFGAWAARMGALLRAPSTAELSFALLSGRTDAGAKELFPLSSIRDSN